ncbi:tetratricopeptide repeat protein 28-like isoform X2 [Branchiostoma lanceolatum]|uniref:tetratricopeptide repeat protein 28-like isoform X2 n=1 Tax=Branchiostoma lanceolatum TaxID=7740 RepID=UPI0034520754
MYLGAVLVSLFLAACTVLVSYRVAWETSPPVGTHPSRQNMEDLPVDGATLALVRGKMEEIESHLQDLRNAPGGAWAPTQGTAENLQEIQGLMGRNLPLASRLVDSILEDEAMDAAHVSFIRTRANLQELSCIISQRLAYLHLKLEIVMATGPVEDGLAAANQAYLLATTHSSIPLRALFQACLDAGDAHRVRGLLDKARHFYSQARDVAAQIDPTDSQARDVAAQIDPTDSQARDVAAQIDPTDSQARDVAAQIDPTDSQARDVAAQIDPTDSQARDVAAQIDPTDSQARDVAAQIDPTDSQARDVAAQIDPTDSQARDVAAQIDPTDSQARDVAAQIDPTDSQARDVAAQIDPTDSQARDVAAQIDPTDSQARDVAAQMDPAADPAEAAVLAEIHLGMLQLASGHLNTAIRDSFLPLLGQNMGQHNRGRLLQHLGNAYRSAADWGPAKDHLREAVSMATEMGDEIEAAGRHGDLGNVYRSEGRTAEALQEQEKQYSFALQRGDLSGLCTACFNKGFTFYSMQPAPDYPQALLFLTLQLALARRLGDPGMQGKALNCLGKVYTGMQQPDQAVVLLKQTIALHHSTGNVAGEGMAHGNLGTAYRDLGRHMGTAYRDLGRYEEAVVNHQTYLQNADSRDDVGGVAIMQRELALDHLFSKDYAMAERCIRDAVVTLERIRGRLGPEDSSRIAHNEKNQADAYNILQHILALQGNSQDALVMAERGRGRALADLMRAKVDRMGEREAPIIDSIADITALAAELHSSIVFYSLVTEQGPYSVGERWVYCWVVDPGDGKVTFTRTPLQGDPVQVERGELDQGYYNTLLRSMGDLSVEEPEPSQDSDENTSDSQETSDDSDEDDLDRVPALKVKPTPSTQQPQEQRWETQQARERRWETQLRADYDLLIKPIEKFLPTPDGREAAPKITFIPHGFLFSVPFCALVATDGDHLVQKYSVSMAPSVQVLQLSHRQLQTHRRSRPGASVLAVGNPAPDPARRLPPLREAGKEAELAYRGLGETGLWLTGGNATKDCVRDEMPRHTVLHFAAHASHTGCHDQPADATRAAGNYSMPGYIVLSKSHPSCGGILTAEEIRGMELSAQLVVLSCCNTGLGTVTGDGVLGMYRAFLAAGSANVVVTLWRIPDRKTRRLMRHFYSSYRRSRDAAQAMRDAMLHMLQNKKTSAPPYWAAFSVIGATTPL